MTNSTMIQATYDYRLVALSVLIAIFASYAALDLATRVSAGSSRARLAWLFGGAAAMGTGIWSMHYTGMLAFRLPMPVYYHVPTVLLSLAAAIGASFIALFVIGRERIGVVHLAIGSLLMAAGIAAMHYTGMAAMRLAAMHQYETGLVVASIVVAWLVSLAGLGLMKLNLVLGPTEVRDGGTERLLKIVCAITMGFAIPGMHYTGMAAISYTPMSSAPDLTNAVEISALANAAIVVVTFVMLGSVFLLGWWPSLLRGAPLPDSKDVAVLK